MKVYNVKNMNEWGEMEQKEVNGVVVKVAVIGEQNDLQTGEKTPLCEEVYASIIQNNDNYYIEGNDKEYPFVRVRQKEVICLFLMGLILYLCVKKLKKQQKKSQT